jgi:hypothetical protein
MTGLILPYVKKIDKMITQNYILKFFIAFKLKPWFYYIGDLIVSSLSEFKNLNIIKKAKISEIMQKPDPIKKHKGMFYVWLWTDAVIKELSALKI